MKKRKIYFKQQWLKESDPRTYRVVKTVDAGTEFKMGDVLGVKEVDELNRSSRYTVTIS